MTNRKVLIAVAGLPGSGKSTAARICARLLGADWLSTDVIRKQLFPVPGYSPDESAATYNTFFQRAEDALKQGRSVVMDATFVLRRSRQQARAIAEQTGAYFLLLFVTAPEDVIRQRIASRMDDPSDADFEVYLKMKEELEPIRCDHLLIENGSGLDHLEQELARLLRLQTR